MCRIRTRLEWRRSPEPSRNRRSIHTDYLKLGARVIVANTFATGANILRDVGAPERFEEVNRRAVKIADARAAAGPAADHVVVGAGISNWSFSGDRPDLVTLRDDTAPRRRSCRTPGRSC